MSRLSGGMEREDLPDSPQSIEVRPVDAGRWQRELEARLSLVRIKEDTVEEVDHGAPPVPHSSLEFVGGFEELRKRWKMEETEETMPEGLMWTLGKIHDASKNLLEEMNEMEVKARYVGVSDGPKAVKGIRANIARNFERIKQPESRMRRNASDRALTLARQKKYSEAISEKGSKRKPNLEQRRNHEQEEHPARKSFSHNSSSREKMRKERLKSKVRFQPKVEHFLSGEENLQSEGNQSNDKRRKDKQESRLELLGIEKNKNELKGSSTFTRKVGVNNSTSELDRKREKDTKFENHDVMYYENSPSLRDEVEAIRDDVERLRTMSLVKSSLKAVEGEAETMLNRLPEIQGSISNMEAEASRASRELQGRIQTLVKSYRDMNTLASHASIGFMSALDPYDTLSNQYPSEKKRADWLPPVPESFDYDILQSEVQMIKEAKSKLDANLKLAHLSSPQEVDGEGGVQHQVEARIRRVDAQISAFVERSFDYQSRLKKQGSRNRPGRKLGQEESGPVHYLAPWMAPSKWSEHMARKEAAKAPIVPPVLQEAMEREQEEFSEVKELELKWRRRERQKRTEEELVSETKALIVRSPLNEPSVKDSRRSLKEGGRKRTSISKAMSLNNEPVKAAKQETEIDGKSVDSITDLLNRLEGRRELQEEFEADERKVENIDLGRKESQSIIVKSDPDEETKGERKKASSFVESKDDSIPVDVHDNQDEAIDEDSISNQRNRVLSRLSVLLHQLGRPRMIALRAAFRCCQSILIQLGDLDFQEVLEACVDSTYIVFFQTLVTVRQACFKAITEVLVQENLRGSVPDSSLAQFLILLDALPCPKETCEISFCEIVGIISCAYRLVNGNTMPDRMRGDLTLMFSAKDWSNLTEFPQTAGAGVKAAAAVHHSMLSKLPFERFGASLAAATSAIKFGHQFYSDDPMQLASIQIIALLDVFQGRIGETDLSNLSSSVTAFFSRNGVSISAFSQICLRCIVSSLAEVWRQVQDSLNAERSQINLTSSISKGMLSSDDLCDFESALCSQSDWNHAEEAFRAVTSFDQQDLLSMPELLSPSSLFGYVFSLLRTLSLIGGPGGARQKFLTETVQVRLLFDACQTEVNRLIVGRESLFATNEDQTVKLVEAVAKNLNRVLTNISKSPTTVTNLNTRENSNGPAGILLKGVDSKSDICKTPILSLNEHPTPMSEHPLQNKMVARYEDVLDYLSSAVYAELLVKEQNCSLESQPVNLEEDIDLDEEEPLLNGGVVQWFVDQGAKVDDHAVNTTVGTVLEAAIRKQSFDQTQRNREIFFDDFWSDENILELVTQLFLDRAMEAHPHLEEAEVIDLQAEGALEQNQSRSEMELAAAAAMASSLAVESAERSLVEREKRLRELQGHLDEEKESIIQETISNERQSLERRLNEREEQLSFLHQQIIDQRSQQAELEELRTTQLATIIEKIGTMQEKTFSAALGNIKDLVADSILKLNIQRAEVSMQHRVNLQPSKPSDSLELESMDSDTTPKLLENPVDSDRNVREEKIEDEDNLLKENELDNLKQSGAELKPVDDSLGYLSELEISRIDGEAPHIPDGKLLYELDQTSDGETKEALEPSKADTAEVGLMTDIREYVETIQASENRNEILLTARAPRATNEVSVTPTAAFTSTLLEWSENESDSGNSDSSGESRSLSEGELDISVGDLSDGEAVSLAVAYRTALQPKATHPPWSFGKGPNSELLNSAAKLLSREDLRLISSQGGGSKMEENFGNDDEDLSEEEDSAKEYGESSEEEDGQEKYLEDHNDEGEMSFGNSQT